MQGKQQQQPQSQKTLNIKRKRSKRPCMNTLWTEIESLKKKLVIIETKLSNSMVGPCFAYPIGKKHKNIAVL